MLIRLTGPFPPVGPRIDCGNLNFVVRAVVGAQVKNAVVIARDPKSVTARRRRHDQGTHSLAVRFLDVVRSIKEVGDEIGRSGTIGKAGMIGQIGHRYARADIGKDLAEHSVDLGGDRKRRPKMRSQKKRCERSKE